MRKFKWLALIAVFALDELIDELEAREQAPAPHVPDEGVSVLERVEPLVQIGPDLSGALHEAILHHDLDDLGGDGGGQRVARVGVAVHEAARLHHRVDDRVAGDDGPDGRVAAREPLGDADDVGRDVPVLIAIEDAGAAAAGHHVVDDQHPAGHGCADDVAALAVVLGFLAVETVGQVTVVALAIACFAVAQSLHGSGYIAAFTGGLLFGFMAKDATHRLVLAAEGTGETLALMTWMLFGALVVGHSVQYFTWEMLVYAFLSLTVIRMLPIFLSLSGTGESTASKLFLGWFGPRGLASIVFAIIVVNKGVPGGKFIAMVVVLTVFFSLVDHGVFANPLARLLGQKEGEKEDKQYGRSIR